MTGEIFSNFSLVFTNINTSRFRIRDNDKETGSSKTVSQALMLQTQQEETPSLQQQPHSNVKILQKHLTGHYLHLSASIDKWWARLHNSTAHTVTK